MSSKEARSRLLLKLAHPMNDVRERVLEQLRNELLVEWPTSEEETSNLLHALLASFFRRHWRPSHEPLALSLLRDAVESEWGPSTIKEMGAHRLLETLQKNSADVSEEAQGAFQDLLAAVRPLITMESGGAEGESPNAPRPHVTPPSSWDRSSEDEGHTEMKRVEHVAAEATRDESAESTTNAMQ